MFRACIEFSTDPRENRLAGCKFLSEKLSCCSVLCIGQQNHSDLQRDGRTLYGFQGWDKMFSWTNSGDATILQYLVLSGGRVSMLVQKTMQPKVLKVLYLLSYLVIQWHNTSRDLNLTIFKPSGLNHKLVWSWHQKTKQQASLQL